MPTLRVFCLLTLGLSVAHAFARWTRHSIFLACRLFVFRIAQKSTRNAVALAGAIFLLPVSGAWAETTYTGTYTCAQGLTNLKLILKDDFSGGVFDFSVPVSFSGSFNLVGSRVDNKIELNPSGWISRPSNYVMVSLSGSISSDGSSITGVVTGSGGCTTFSVKRESSNTPPITPSVPVITPTSTGLPNQFTFAVTLSRALAAGEYVALNFDDQNGGWYTETQPDGQVRMTCSGTTCTLVRELDKPGLRSFRAGVFGASSQAVGAYSASATCTLPQCLAAIAMPVCTVTATPSSVVAGSLRVASILSATCNPQATSFRWSDACGGSTDSTKTTCIVTPHETTTYTVQGINAVGVAGKPASVTVSVIPGPSYTMRAVFPDAKTKSEVMQGGRVTRWFALESPDGAQPIAMQNIRYQISGEAEKATTTDENGLFSIETDPQVVLTPDSSAPHSKYVRVMNTLDAEFDVVVATRSLEETWLMEARLQGEAGVGPLIGIEAKVSKIGAKLKTGLSVGFGLGATYGISAVYKSNIANDGYLYAAQASIPSNQSLSTSQTLGIEASANVKPEFSAITIIGPKTFFGTGLSMSAEIKGIAKSGATVQFPDYFHSSQPIGPCHLGWQVASQLLFPQLTTTLSLANKSPTDYLCGSPLANYLSEYKESTSFVGTGAFEGNMGFSGYSSVSQNKGVSRLGKLSMSAIGERGFQLTGEWTQKYKKGIKDDIEDKVEIVYGLKIGGGIKSKLTALHEVLGQTYKMNFNAKLIDGMERKLSRTEVRSATGVWKATKLGTTVSSISAISTEVPAVGSLGLTQQEDINITVETDNANDAIYIPGMPQLDWDIVDPVYVDNALAEILSRNAKATESPLKLGIETESFFYPTELSIDLGAALGLKLNANAALKLSSSEKYSTEVSKVYNATLNGKSVRKIFNLESYTNDDYLKQQRKSTVTVFQQMQIAITRFTEKILASAKVVVKKVGDKVITTVNAASDKISELSSSITELNEEWILTVERWSSDIQSFTSPIYRARNIATTETEAIIGPIHFVNVKTAAGVERDALPPGTTLKIGQVSQYLSGANTSLALIKNVRIYRIDFDTSTKTLIGGTYHADLDQMVVNLSRTGAYIMILDTKSPTITSNLINLDNSSDNLRVSASLNDDVTGIDGSTIALLVNGINVLKNTDIASYFNAVSRNFQYVIPSNFLMPGKNEIQLKISDGAGNQRTAVAQVHVGIPVATSLIIPSVASAVKGASVVSDPITVSSTTNPVIINVTNGEYRVNGGAWTAATGTVKNGDVVNVRVTASTTAGATVLATLSIGNSSGSFSVTTANIALDDGTVTDPNTGLTWKRCMEGQTWSYGTCTGTFATYTFDQANALTGKVTFAGQSDWRMPNIRELTTIVDYTKVNPAIDLNVFPNTAASIVWSGSPLAVDASNVWVVNFSDGGANYNGRNYSSGVRLVRGGQQSFEPLNGLERPDTDYVNHGDGTTTHTPTGLMWQRCMLGQTWSGSTCTGTASKLRWDAAKAITSNFAGKADWRLPTERELLSLVDYTTTEFHSPINAGLFPNDAAADVWSDSRYASDAGFAWVVYFNFGGSTNGNRRDDFGVRLVRGGQPLAALPPTDINCFLNWAEALVPDLLTPANGAAKRLDSISYRAYSNGLYAGVQGGSGTVLAVGGALGPLVQKVGNLADFLPAARAASCKK